MHAGASRYVGQPVDPPPPKKQVAMQGSQSCSQSCSHRVVCIVFMRCFPRHATDSPCAGGCRRRVGGPRLPQAPCIDMLPAVMFRPVSHNERKVRLQNAYLSIGALTARSFSHRIRRFGLLGPWHIRLITRATARPRLAQFHVFRGVIRTEGLEGGADSALAHAAPLFAGRHPRACSPGR